MRFKRKRLDFLKRALKRITLPSAVASVPLLALSIIFAFSFWPLSGLERIISYEILLVHAFPFLGAVVFFRARQWRWRIVRWICFLGLLTLYLGTAYKVDHWIGVITILSLGLANYLRIFFIRDSEALLQQMGSRWLVALMAIFGTAIICGTVGTFILGKKPEITTDPCFGALFFLALGLCELFRIYDAMEEASCSG